VAEGCKDYYELLGVGRAADEKTIKSAYRRLALKYHPDVANCKQGADRFRGIREAYAVLSDPEQRARYGPLWATGRDRGRAHQARSPKREDRVSRSTARSYSFGLSGLGIHRGFGWRT
jgi:DnaJ-class molecular chaperone